MKIAVRYYTKTGNTKKLAEAVAKAVPSELRISLPVASPAGMRVYVPSSCPLAGWLAVLTSASVEVKLMEPSLSSL